MTDDKYPKEFLQTKLFTMGQDADKAIEAHYTAIGKVVYARTPETQKNEQIAAERELIRFFEGQKHGLSLASNEVSQMIPDHPEQTKVEKLSKLGRQLANWVHNSGFTKAEFDELKNLAEKYINEDEKIGTQKN